MFISYFILLSSQVICEFCYFSGGGEKRGEARRGRKGGRGERNGWMFLGRDNWGERKGRRGKKREEEWKGEEEGGGGEGGRRRRRRGRGKKSEEEGNFVKLFNLLRHCPRDI